MRYLSVAELLKLHRQVIAASGGSYGLRDAHGLESAAAQPRMSFGGADLYPTLADKAAALAFSLINNHPFVDGNKRIGYIALQVFLELNGQTLAADVDEKERVILAVAASTMEREEFTAWVSEHIQTLDAGPKL